jgi:hypothetical protein
MASNGGDYSGPGRPVRCYCQPGEPHRSASSGIRCDFFPDGATIQSIVADFLAVETDDRHPFSIGGAPLRVLVDITYADARPAAHHRLELSQQYFAQMTAATAIDNEFQIAVQGTRMTGAGFLVAAMAAQPENNPARAPATPLMSPNCGSREPSIGCDPTARVRSPLSTRGQLRLACRPWWFRRSTLRTFRSSRLPTG